MNRSMPRLLVVTSILILLGCSPTPKVSKMIPTLSDTYSRSDKSLVVGRIVGGRGSDFWEGSKISADGFRQALQTTISDSQLFQAADSASVADYRLDALIKGQDQPTMGLNMTSTLLVKYTVVRVATDEEIFQKEIHSEFTATLTSCCYGPIRLNKANEGAVRVNIEKLVGELAQIDV